jgi:hypothetical protein
MARSTQVPFRFAPITPRAGASEALSKETESNR